MSICHIRGCINKADNIQLGHNNDPSVLLCTEHAERMAGVVGEVKLRPCIMSPQEVRVLDPTYNIAFEAGRQEGLKTPRKYKDYYVTVRYLVSAQSEASARDEWADGEFKDHEILEVEVCNE